MSSSGKDWHCPYKYADGKQCHWGMGMKSTTNLLPVAYAQHVETYHKPNGPGSPQGTPGSIRPSIEVPVPGPSNKDMRRLHKLRLRSARAGSLSPGLGSGTPISRSRSPAAGSSTTGDNLAMEWDRKPSVQKLAALLHARQKHFQAAAVARLKAQAPTYVLESKYLNYDPLTGTGFTMPMLDRLWKTDPTVQSLIGGYRVDKVRALILSPNRSNWHILKEKLQYTKLRTCSPA